MTYSVDDEIRRLTNENQRLSDFTKWISVKDRLPDEDVDVLLYWDESFPFDVGHYCGDDIWQRANDNMSEYDADPTYWMPLPEIPE